MKRPKSSAEVEHRTVAEHGLPAGTHTVNVIAYQWIEKKWGRGVSIVMEGHNGKKASFFSKAMPEKCWPLNEFAEACGLTDSEFDAYDLTQDNCHDILIGRVLSIDVDKNMGSGYSQVPFFAPQEQRPFRKVGETLPTGPSEPPTDEIPF